MERLTARVADLETSAVNQMGHGYIRVDDIDEAMEKLSLYEDTGLEPEEIPVLLDRLKRASEQWNIWCDAYQKDVSVWIPVMERLPSILEYSGCEECEKYYREFEIAVQTDTLEYCFGYFDGYKWFDKCHRRFNGDVVAWKVHQPFSPQN